VPVQVFAQARGPEQGGPVEKALYVALFDLSELRRLEEERRRSAEAEQAALAASRAKDEFIAMLSHELRTPLAPVLNAAETLAAANLGGGLGEAAAAIKRNVLVEARLIDDLLDAARVTQKLMSIERRPLSLHDLIRREAEDRKADYARDGLELRLSLDARSDTIDADPGRLAQVLRNLLVNAEKFTPAGGRVTVHTEDAKGFVRMSVTDTGQGMTQEELARLFEPFQLGRLTRAGRAGLGLGLAISRGIVEAHGGTLHALSAGAGEGCTIEIDLPLTSALAPVKERRSPLRPSLAAAAAEPASREKAAASAAVVQVLVVDDHEDSAETLALLLKLQGYGVKVAHSVREAESEALGCDVLISDIALPDGSGLDLVRTLRRDRPLPAIALSGFGTEQDRRQSREAGFAEHLTKPVYADQLLAVLRRISPSPAV
jgi:signal transduction histidine kinase/CheY-like chemotaxis protein